uniref:Uncharacterized protein n=1 Tax=Plectus sambesii TaxID=2011161 RepID=A0A914WG29_9BILA
MLFRPEAAIAGPAATRHLHSCAPRSVPSAGTSGDASAPFISSHLFAHPRELLRMRTSSAFMPTTALLHSATYAMSLSWQAPAAGSQITDRRIALESSDSVPR